MEKVEKLIDALSVCKGNGLKFNTPVSPKRFAYIETDGNRLFGYDFDGNAICTDEIDGVDVRELWDAVRLTMKISDIDSKHIRSLRPLFCGRLSSNLAWNFEKIKVKDESKSIAAASKWFNKILKDIQVDFPMMNDETYIQSSDFGLVRLNIMDAFRTYLEHKRFTM